MVREIGTAARAEITQLLGRPAHLRLHVKVAPDWTDSPEGIARLGYRRENEVGRRQKPEPPEAQERPLVALVGRPNVGNPRCSTAWWAAGPRW